MSMKAVKLVLKKIPDQYRSGDIGLSAGMFHVLFPGPYFQPIDS